MSFFRSELAVFVVCLAVTSGQASADAEMDRILNEAMPHMHHSCESILANYPGDDDAVAEIVGLMVAVSLFNREVNVEEAIPDEAKRASLKVEFIDRLEEECEVDPDALLAGAVDVAVKDALD